MSDLDIRLAILDDRNLRWAAAVGWDDAVRATQYEDGTIVEIVSNNNPYRKEKTRSDGEAPVDVTAMQAEAVVEAALDWARTRVRRKNDLVTHAEWTLIEACGKYGDTYKGLKGQ